MKNFKMKNVILGVLIAVMSIACFAVVGVTLNNVPKYEREQGIHIAGLEFEDGWNLISDAEDYYLMTENTSTGKNAGAKYRLTNDITINPYKAKQDVFIGATLDGAEYNISYEEEPEYLPDCNIRQFGTFTDYGDTLTWDGGMRSMSGTFVGSAGLDATPNQFNITEWNSEINVSDLEIHLAGKDESKVYCIGGAYGIVYNSTIKNLRVVFSGDVHIYADGYDVAVGGIAGYVNSSTITNCLVGDGSYYGFEIHVVSYDWQDIYVGGIAGVAVNNCSITNNIVIRPHQIVGSNYVDSQKGVASGWNSPIGGSGGMESYGCCTLYLTDETYAEQLKGSSIENIAYSSLEFYEMERDADIDWICRPDGMGILIQYVYWQEKLGKVGFLANKWGMEYGKDDDLYLLDEEEEGYAGIYGLNQTFQFIKPRNPEIPGYVFKGWSSAMGHLEPILDNTLVSELTLYGDNVRWVYAYFEPITYSIVYNSDKTSTDGLEPTSFTRDSEYIDLPKLTCTGHYFEGWKLKNGSVVSGFKGNEDEIFNCLENGKLVLNAVWTPIGITINLEPIDGSILKGESLINAGYNISGMGDWRLDYDGQYYLKVYGYGQRVTLPKPERDDGYKFAGWYKDSDFTQGPYEQIDVIPPEGSTTMFYIAKWIQPIKATLDYNYKLPDGADRTGEINKLQYGGDYGNSLTTATTTKPGYNFLGWTSDYLDVSSFIRHYTSEGASSVSSTKPYVTDSGWLCLSGPMAWDGTRHWGYPIYLPNGNYQLSAIAQGSKDDQYGFGGSLLMVECDADYTVPGNISGRQQFRITVDETGPTDNVEKSGVYTVNDESGGLQFCLFHSYNTGNNVYYKDIRITRLNDDGTEAKYQGIYNRPNELRIIDAESAVIAPYDHTLYANWSDELDVIEFDTGSGIIASMLHSNEGAQFDGNPGYLNLGRTYMYTDTLYVTFDAYMDDWSQLGRGTFISCTEYAGWRIAGDDNNTGYIEFELRTINNDGYKTVTSKEEASELSSGWHTFTAMYDGRKMALYIDNILQAEMRVTDDISDDTSYEIFYNSTNSIFVGGEATSNPSEPGLGDWGFKGKMRNIRIANDIDHEGYNNEETIGFGGIHYINLGRKYMFEDKIYVSVDAYMDDWSQLGVGTLISCTEYGGWRLGGADTKSGYISFSLMKEKSSSYDIVYSTNPASSLTSGWHTFTAMYDGSKMALYIDNILQQRTSITGKISYNGTNSMFVGGEATSLPSEPSLGDWGFKGKMRNLYIANTPTVRSYYHKDVIKFDGVDDCVDLGTQYQFTDSLYISFMAYMEDWDEYNSNNMHFMSCNADDGAFGWEFIIDDQDKISFLVYHSQGSVIIRAKKSISDFLDKTWYKFKIVWDGSKVYYYINEELQNDTNDTEVTLSEIAYSSDISICLGREGLGEGFFKGALSNIYISNGKGCAQIYYDSSTAGDTPYQRFPALVHSGERKFIGWALDDSELDLEGNMLGDTITFFNGIGFKAYGNEGYDGQILLGFNPGLSSGAARLIAKYDDATIPFPGNWEKPEGGDDEPIEGDGNEIQDPQPDLNIAVFTIELQYGDANIEGYNLSNEKVSFDGIYIIYLDGHGGFDLPDSSHVTRYGYTFDKWQVISSDYTEWPIGANPIAVPNGVNINAKLKAVWTENVYGVKIHSNVPGNDTTHEKTIYKHTESIKLSLNELFGLQYNIVGSGGVGGYRFVGWTVSYENKEFEYNNDKFSDKHSNLGYAEINARYDKINNYSNNSTSDGEANTFEQLFTNWGIVSVDNTYYPMIFKDIMEVSELIHGYATTGAAEGGYCIDIYAVWTPVYTVTIQANMDGENHNCGSGACECGIYHSGGKTAPYGDESAYIVPQNEQYEFGESTVTQTIKTQHYFKGYEIPGFDFEHVFNKPTGFGLHYYGHEIYGWIVQANGDTYKLDYKKDANGNYITDANGDYILEDGGDITDWLEGSDTDIMPSGINLKYLQGDIILTPQWRPVVFDVEFKTANGQGYKNNYKDIVQKSQVTFGSTYSTTQGAVPTTGGNIGTLYATDIYGYTVIYAHPYNANSVDSGKYITTTGTWDYMLKYETYSGGKVSPYGNKFYIEIEGYYAPDLYRVKLDLDLPYTDNNNFNVEYNNGFVEGATLGDSIYTMSPYVKYDSETYSVDKYVLVYVENEPKYMYKKTGYQNYQHKLINDKGVYYIYLLQDQVVGYDEDQKCAYIENAYYNGKKAEPNQVAKKYLPTFEIDYYEMQYYYAIGNDENNTDTLINKYQTAELVDYHKTLSDQKLKEKYGSDITVDEKLDWKYTYNIPADNTQISDYESGNVVSTIYIYWYRNILNLDIYNMINPNDSNTAKDQTTVGYVLVTETEQVTSSLIDHKQYHLVIYAYNNGQLGYVVYEFDDISVLQIQNSDLYKYIKLLGKSDDYLTLEDLKELSTIENVNILAANDINSDGKYIPIYFGNRVTIEAVDQSKDQSLDEFIGYRFRNFEYGVTDSGRTDISELNGNNYDNDESEYISSEDGRYTRSVSIDLQKYEYGKDFTEDEKDNPNITNYFVDQDLLTIKAHFEPIKYKFNYQTVDETYTYYPSAGNIRLNYDGTSVNGMVTETVSSRFAYYVNVNAIGNNTSICNYMNIELGYEHLNWYIYKNEYSQEDSTNVPIKNGDTQEFIFRVDAEFLRLYYGTNYTTGLVQDVYGYSECKLMEFNIQVHVIDVSTGADVREPYELSTSDELFKISPYPLTLNDKTPSNNNYVITMLKGAEGYTFVTYVHGGKAYILQELYIKTAGSSITIKDFMTMYPAKDLGQYNINVTSGLLDQAITYSQYVELEEDDRVLHFYVDVAPVVTMEFEVVDSGDQNLSERVLMIGSETIAKGLKDEEFKVEVTSDGKESTYVGYWGQDILLTFIAGNHYRSIDFEIEYVDENQKEKIDQLSIIPGNNKIYTLKGDSTAKIKIVPNTYDLTAYITYNGTHYEIDEYDLITNAVGDKIFESVEVSAHGDNISNTLTAGMYYTGDKFDILYQLNPDVLKDITVEVLENGDSVDMYDDNRDGVADGIIEFSNVGIELEIRVQDKVQAVKLKSNYQDKYAADIQAKVNNNDNWTLVQDKTGIKNVVFNLVRGDVLTVYIKEQVGFRFNKTYSCGFAGGTVDAGEFDGGWMFTLFADDGFTAEDNGTYTLNFTQIPFEVEFEHYLTTGARKLEGSEIPAECIAVKDMTDNERYIQSGSKVKLSKSADKTGYRFNGYTYVAPQGKESAIGLGDEFIVDETMLQHLATVGTNEKGNVPIVIYLNYVKQYTFNISAKGASVQILDNDNNEINPSKYYDFGTEFKVKAKANDSEHYQIKASINGTEVSDENQDYVSIPENTNLGNLSGFTTVNYTLNNNYKILVEVVAEKYSIKLNQALNNGTAIEEDDETLATQGTWFNLSDNVYYRALGTFGYNTEVEIHIFVENPQVDESTYYVLNKVLVDGREVSVKAGNQSTVDGKQGVMYTVKHTVLGEPLVANSAITSEITVTFNALYYVTVIQ